MEYTRFSEIIDNDRIELDDGIATLKSGYSEEDKELFDNFVKTVNTYGYGIKSVIERN